MTKEYSNLFSLSVSYTTRAPRPEEKNGVEYYFVSEEEFNKMVKENQLLESCHVHGSYYGTAKKEIERIAKEKKVKSIQLAVDLHFRIRRSRSIKN